MKNYKLKLEYNGANFSGSQIQDAQESSTKTPIRTVQSELEDALKIYLKEDVDCIFSSRTDAGVHAIGQVVNFKSPQDLSDSYKVVHNLNGILPEDIAAVKIEEADDNFHARFHAKSRKYLYKIFTRRQRPVLRLDSLAWEREPLDFEKMQEHARSFIGEHDFEKYCFRAADHYEDPNDPETKFKSTKCIVYESELIKENELCYKYHIKANRFLRQMVRNLVGEIIAVGKGKEAKASITPAPAQGLTLVKVEY